MKKLIFLMMMLMMMLMMIFSCENVTKPNEKENIMNKQDRLRIVGKYRTIVHRGATGKVEISEWKKNTIHANLKEKVNDIFLVNSDFALDNLFSVNQFTPPIGEDGIMLEVAPEFYSMICSSSKPTATSIKITGTFTGFAVTITGAQLGWNIETTGNNFTVRYADATSWDDITLASVDTLTIEWTITVG